MQKFPRLKIKTFTPSRLHDQQRLQFGCRMILQFFGNTCAEHIKHYFSAFQYTNCSILDQLNFNRSKQKCSQPVYRDYRSDKQIKWQTDSKVTFHVQERSCKPNADGSI